MALHRNPADRFDANLRIVTRAGIEAPPEIAALRERLDTFRRNAFGKNALNMVVDGVVNGTDDMGLLWAAACAEASIPDHAKNDLVDAVRDKVNAAVRAAYAEVAASRYQTVASKFDEAAQAFTAAASICDPNTPAAAVVGASDRARKAWTATGVHAEQLTTLLPVLRAAAELAGICGTQPDDIIDLVVDPNGLTRDQIVYAWDTPDREAAEARQHNSMYTTPEPTHTRGGRWTALVAAKAVIRAHPIRELETTAVATA